MQPLIALYFGIPVAIRVRVQELPSQASMLQNELPAVDMLRSIAPTDVLPLEERFRRSLPGGATFRNPILPAPSADPWVIQHDGWYYYCESRQQDSIWIRKARCFTDLG